MDLIDLTPRQLKRAAVIKERIAALAHELAKLLGTSANGGPARHVRRISAAGRRKIAAAQRARWAMRRQPKSGDFGARARKKSASTANASRSAKMKAFWAKKKAKKKGSPRATGRSSS